MDIGSGKNFAIIAKLSSQWLFGFGTQDPSVAQLIYKKREGGGGGGGGGAFIFIHFFPPPPPPLGRLVPEPRSPALSPFAVPYLLTSYLARVALPLAPIVARAYCSHVQPSPGLALHCHQPSTSVRAACLSLHCPSLRRCFSPLSVPPLPVPPSESSA